MITEYITAYFELFLFLTVEIILVISFLIFKRYSRNHGGAFDRRIEERRSYKRRSIDNTTGGMELAANGVSSLQIESSSGNDLFNISVENFITGRRTKVRRHMPDRRKV